MINLTVVEDNVTITVSEVGPTGPAGQGVPTGGTAGQVLTKLSGTNYDTAWTTNGAGTVTSVGITESSAALNITGSPITSSGNINIGFAGTSAQYVTGDGSLVTFPTTLDEAKRLVTQVTNRSGALMTKGTIVYINGAQGNLPTIAKAIATGDPTSAQTFGWLQTDIANNASGYLVVAGKIDNLDTSAVAEGAQLYLSSTTAGAYTTTKQYAPAHLVYVGVVVRSHPTQGAIEVNIQNGYELDELHNVSAQTPSNNDGIFYNSSTQLWENKSINSVLGVTPIGLTSLSGVAPVSYNNTNGQFSMAAANGSVPGYLTTTDWNTFNSKVAPTTSVSTTAPLQGGGNLSSSRNISITKSDVSTDGYLSSTDWNTFNNKVDSSRQVSVTSPLTGGGNLSSNVSIGITAASSLTDGYVTASDFVDFKNGIKQLGSQTVGYFTKYSGDKAIAQSSVYEDGTTLFLPAIVKQSGLGNSKAVVTDGSGNTVSATIGTGLSLVGGVLTATGTGTGSIGGSGTINTVPKFSGTSSIGDSNIQDSGSLITLGSNTYVNGGLGIGTSTLTARNLVINRIVTGSSTGISFFNTPTFASDVTSAATTFRSSPTTQTASFVLGTLNHFQATNTTIGVGSTITTQVGFVTSALSGATNNYGFQGQLAAATNSYNLYMSGTADNYLAGSLGIGSVQVNGGPILTITLTSGGSGYVDGTYTDVAMTGGGGQGALATFVVSGGIVTTATLTWGGANYIVGGLLSAPNTSLGGTGSGLSITVATVDSSQFSIGNANGADITLFRNDTTLNPSDNVGSIKWMSNDTTTKASGIIAEISAMGESTNGGASLRFYTRAGVAGSSLLEAMRIGGAGSVGIGATTLTQYSLRISKDITGSTVSYSQLNDGVIQSGVTSSAHYYASTSNTAAASFALTSIYHYRTIQGTFGAGSTVTNQYGFFVDSTLIGATNNYGFFGNIPSGTNRWNLYMSGTANNYLAGNLLIGSTTDNGNKLQVSGTISATGLSLSGTSVSVTTTMSASYYMWIFTGAAGQTLNLYSASGHNNNHFIKNSSANSLTLAGANIETLTSTTTVSSITIPAYKTVEIISNGGAVWIVKYQS